MFSLPIKMSLTFKNHTEKGSDKMKMHDKYCLAFKQYSQKIYHSH